MRQNLLQWSIITLLGLVGTLGFNSKRAKGREEDQAEDLKKYCLICINLILSQNNSEQCRNLHTEITTFLLLVRFQTNTKYRLTTSEKPFDYRYKTQAHEQPQANLHIVHYNNRSINLGQSLISRTQVCVVNQTQANTRSLGSNLSPKARESSNVKEMADQSIWDNTL